MSIAAAEEFPRVARIVCVPDGVISKMPVPYPSPRIAFPFAPTTNVPPTGDAPASQPPPVLEPPGGVNFIIPTWTTGPVATMRVGGFGLAFATGALRQRASKETRA